MKILQIQKYQCEVCGESYGTESAAKKCEARPVSQDKGVKIDDVVLITKGDGQGSKATVESRFVFSMEWGHYQWERYWHTVGITAKLNDSLGHRQLAFDSYEPVADNEANAQRESVSSMSWVDAAMSVDERRERLIKRGWEMVRAEARTAEGRDFADWMLARGWEAAECTSARGNCQT